jgi:RimJ/RimL family protein N-acetyltransferase
LKVTLATSRLVLRELVPSDLDFVATMLAHPDVNRYYEKQYTRTDAEAWLNRQLARYAKDGHGLWLVSERASGEPVGQVGLLMQDVEGRRHPEIGWLLHRPYWGRGYATEAAAGTRALAKNHWGYTRLISLIRPTNLPSQRVAERIGMRAGPRVQFHDFEHVVYETEPEHRERMPFDLQPVLKGELIELRPLRPDDFDELFAVASDPLIWEQHPDNNRWQEDVFRDFFRQALESGGALVAIDTRDGKLIGSSRYHGYHAGTSEVEIGWTFLARAYWGGRYNGEMKRLMLQHAFWFVDRVIFHIGVSNYRSQRAVEKIGGVRTGPSTDANGRESFVYQMTATAFARATP